MSRLRNARSYLQRLSRQRSPAAVNRAVRREVALRGAARRSEARLARAARRGEPLLAGPFLGEIGFELLYWIPLLRHLVSHHGLDPGRVTAVSRGGAGPWYEGVAGDYVDVLDLFSPDAYGQRLEQRRREAGDRKQMTSAALDQEIARLVEQRRGERFGALIHPSLLFVRLRYFWRGERELGEVLDRADFQPLSAPGPPAYALPDRYVAVKVYFSDCFPQTEANARFAAELLAALAARIEVVVLPSDFAFDDHRAPVALALPNLHVLDRDMDARENLRLQTEVIAAATGLVGTYGGFSYLAPMLGLPAHTVYSEHNWNRTHLDVLRAALPAFGSPAYALSDVAETGAENVAAAAVEAAAQVPPRA